MVAIQPKELTRISQSGRWKAYVVDGAERRNIPHVRQASNKKTETTAPMAAVIDGDTDCFSDEKATCLGLGR